MIKFTNELDNKFIIIKKTNIEMIIIKIFIEVINNNFE